MPKWYEGNLPLLNTFRDSSPPNKKKKKFRNYVYWGVLFKWDWADYEIFLFFSFCPAGFSLRILRLVRSRWEIQAYCLLRSQRTAAKPRKHSQYTQLIITIQPIANQLPCINMCAVSTLTKAWKWRKRNIVQRKYCANVENSMCSLIWL